MENKKDALELLDLLIEDASADQNSTISIGFANVLKRVRAHLKSESKPA
jgi:hypothetical protein